MNKPSKKKLYESIDILSREMVKQFFKDNQTKLLKELVFELEEAKAHGEQKDNNENEILDMLLASFREGPDNLPSNRSKNEPNLKIKENKSSKIIGFTRDINKQNSQNQNKFKKLNLNDINKNINSNMEYMEHKDATKNIEIYKNFSDINQNKNKINKSFYKKLTQNDVQTSSKFKLSKDESSIKTKLLNSSFSNNQNSEKVGILKNASKLLNKKNSIFKSSLKSNNINENDKNTNKSINDENNNSVHKIIINYSDTNTNNSNKSKENENEMNKTIKSDNSINENEMNKTIKSNISKNESKENNSNTNINNNDNDNKNNNSNDNNNTNINNNDSKIINKNDNDNDSDNNKKSSYSSSKSSSKTNYANYKKSSSKISENSNSNSLIKELSKENINSELGKQTNKSIENKSKNLEESKNIEIISSFERSKDKKRSQIALQKISLKNYIVYRKKNRTPKQFYEHQLFLMQRQKNIINSRRKKKNGKRR